jgi:hypothetical protein
MKNPYEVLKSKEQEMTRVKKEVEALRVAARLLGGDEATPIAVGGEDQATLRKVVDLP